MAQFGSAPDWGSGGRRFKSCLSDHMELLHEAFKDARATAFSLGNVFLRIGDEENSAVTGALPLPILCRTFTGTKR